MYCSLVGTLVSSCRGPISRYLRVISYQDGMRVTGIIYLHEITQTRIFGTTRKNLDMFRKLCGDEALRNVVIGTTKWDEVKPDKGQQREQELKDTHWKEMLERGSVIMRVDTDPPSVWEIINRILKNDRVEFVRIQEELLEFRRLIPETEAGKTLLYMLEDRRERLLAEERTANMGDAPLRQVEKIRKQLRETTDEIRKLKVPLSEKFKRLRK